MMEQSRTAAHPPATAGGTDCVQQEDVASALASGAQGYLEKPCTPEALVAEILKLSQG